MANAVILGAGLIGIDLAVKLRDSSRLEPTLVVGRNAETKGLALAASLGFETSTRGVDAVTSQPERFDVVFDATTAEASQEHWRQIQVFGLTFVDLTPARGGAHVVPGVHLPEVSAGERLSMVTCGGQTAIPILARLAEEVHLSYIEVVTTAASRSVGRGTLLNLDQYIDTTQRAVQEFTGADRVKVMCNISPARPPSPFRVALYCQLRGKLTRQRLRSVLNNALAQVRTFAPGYAVLSHRLDGDELAINLQVVSRGDKVPGWAGNLDIINAAAVAVGESAVLDGDHVGAR